MNPPIPHSWFGCFAAAGGPDSLPHKTAERWILCKDGYYSGARKRRWDSDGMGVALKKQFLDLLSSVLCHHRVLDFIFLGIPNRRLEQLHVPMGEIGGSILLAVR